MKITELLKRVGLLRYGAEAGPGVSGDFYGSPHRTAKPAGRPLAQSAPAPSNPAQGDGPSSPQAAAPISTGRVAAFGVTVATAIVSAAIFLLGAGFNPGFLVFALLWLGFIEFSRRFAFGGKHSAAAFGVLFCAILIASFLLLGVSVPDSKTATAQESALAIEQVRFAKPGPDGILEPVDSAEFFRGEEVHLVLIRVSGFQAGADGRHWYDLDARLMGPDGQVVVEGADILGEAGHRHLPDGVAKAPEAQFKTTLQSPPGIYRVDLAIKDKIAGLHQGVSRTFTLQ